MRVQGVPCKRGLYEEIYNQSYLKKRYNLQAKQQKKNLSLFYFALPTLTSNRNEPIPNKRSKNILL